MLGVYENFPLNVHKTAIFATSVSSKTLQRALMQTLHELNSKTFSLEEVANQSVPQCTVIFEYGIAEANNFNYLNSEETNKMLKALQKKNFQIMDFFCSLRCYKENNGKKRPLRFDYYMIRFAFNKNMVEISAFHERGPRYVSPTDITNFVVNKINATSSRKMLKAVKSS